ncbi:MAG TPA: carboxypeptidase-like regulatory domain-containing protein, partial [Candidatus Limnocylindrales bacterium]|nr:carboxypeptidase-like regulatory domain-containing protein [Candidatus Limnocylindrales bacterium]
GDIAVGFSASSSSIVPSIRYAGRLASDPLGTLGQGEAMLFAGLGSQSGTSSRWGDYSDMTIDPTDDCTFWYTTEYYPSGVSQFNWRTRIGSFTMPGCGSSPTTGSISGHVTDTNGGGAIPGATVTLSGSGSGTTTTDASGSYTFSNLNATTGYTVAASKSTYTTGAGSTVSNVAVTAGSTTTANLTLTSTVGSISGQVTSTSNGAAISGATVTLGGAGSGSTTTDASGSYSFGGLVPGAYTVTPAKSGYQPASGTSASVSAGANTVRNLTLTPVQVTSTPFDFPTGAAPVTSSAGHNNGYETHPANWFAAFDGNVATDTKSGTAGSSTCGASTRDQETFSGYSFGNLGSSVLGLTIQVRGRASSTANSPRFCIQISTDSGSTWSAGKITGALKTSLQTYTLGSTTDLWGLGLTPASFGTGFRVRITDLGTSTNRTFYLDGVSASVTYQ